MDDVMSVTFAQNSSQVVSGSYDETIWIWNTMTGEVVLRLRTTKGKSSTVVLYQRQASKCFVQSF